MIHEPLPPLAEEIGAQTSEGKPVSSEQLLAWSNRLRGLPVGAVGRCSLAICQIAAYQAEQGAAAVAEQLLDLAISASTELALETNVFHGELGHQRSKDRRQLLAASPKRAPAVGAAAPEGSVLAGGLSARRRA